MGPVSPSPEPAAAGAVGYLSGLSGRRGLGGIYINEHCGVHGAPSLVKAVGSGSISAETLSGRGCVGSP